MKIQVRQNRTVDEVKVKPDDPVGQFCKALPAEAAPQKGESEQIRA